jgi:polysaccharide export outer membrane protein
MRLATIGLSAIVVSGVLVGCTSGGPLGTDLPGGGNAIVANEYIIGPGDRLSVFVWRNEDISVTVPVRPDGKISTPLVEDMQAVGKTPTQLARDIEAVLQEFVRMPQVNIIVEEFVGTFGEQIRVVGQAAEPQALAYRERLTLLDVMIEVGGLTEFASGNRARVVRNESGQSREIHVRLDDLMNDGDMTQNIAMRPGDVVVIPGSFF